MYARKSFFYPLLILLFSLSACKKTDLPMADDMNSNLDTIAAQYYETYLKLYPLEATKQGDNRYNDKLPLNIHKDVISREISFYSSVQKELEAIDYEELSDEKKTVYDVLDNELKTRIEKNVYHPELTPFNQFEGLPLDFPVLGSGKGSQPFATVKDYENWLKRMEAFPLWMDTAILNFREGMKSDVVLPKKLVAKMIPQMNAPEITTDNLSENIFYEPVKNFPREIRAADRERLTTLYKDAITQKIIPAYKKMGVFLEQEYLPKARNTDGYNALPNGANIYSYYVRNWTTTNLTADEIHKTGLAEVKRIRQEMEKVKNQVKFKGTLEEFLTHIKNEKQAMPYRSAAEIINAFETMLDKITPRLSQMFTKTPRTGFEIRQTEKFREASASAEYQPGTPDGKRNGIFYIPIPDASKFNVSSGMESLFLHEAIPGHHYQVSLQQENEKLPKFMRFGWIGAYGEGWALYTESLGHELGLYTDPYQKMGALSDEMMRAVRLVVDTGLHTGRINREEAIAYFLSNVAYDEAGATAEIERYMALPGQALSYKIGSLKITELRSKYQKELGTKFKLAEFHDEVLSQGCLPLSILERKLDLWAKGVKKKKSSNI